MEKHEKMGVAFDRGVIVAAEALILEVREQIQNDLLCYLEKAPSTLEWSPDTVCDIVVDNFKKLLPPKEENS